MRALIAEVLEMRQKIGGIDGVERIDLRYIDEIRIPGGPEQGWTYTDDATSARQPDGQPASRTGPSRSSTSYSLGTPLPLDPDRQRLALIVTACRLALVRVRKQTTR